MRTNDGLEPRQTPVRRAGGGIFFLLVLAIIGGAIASLGLAWVRPGISRFQSVDREKYKRAPGPIPILLSGQPPTLEQTDNAPPSPAIKVIRMFGTRVDLIAGGKLARTIPTKTPVTTLRGLVGVVGDPTWIAATTPGQIELMVGLVVDRSAQLTIAAPDVTRFVLADRDGVMVGAQQGGRLTFDGVTVESDTAWPADIRKYRPFVIASENANLDAKDTKFTNLGWDWRASYGVAWVNGATGSAVRTVFQKSLFGVYTSRVSGLKFLKCVFRDNEIYGFDPHTSSSNLHVEESLAEGNGAHGIIFSEDVVDSVVKNSVSRRNGENGIMMDLRSTGNVIEGNLVEYNKGDGIVTSKSPNVRIKGNVIRHNRVGIRIDAGDVSTVSASGNSISENRLSHEGIALKSSNKTWSNGGQWRAGVLVKVWLFAGAAFVVGALVVLLGSALLRRRVVAQTRAVGEAAVGRQQAGRPQERRHITQRAGTRRESVRR